MVPSGGPEVWAPATPEVGAAVAWLLESWFEPLDPQAATASSATASVAATGQVLRALVRFVIVVRLLVSRTGRGPPGSPSPTVDRRVDAVP